MALVVQQTASLFPVHLLLACAARVPGRGAVWAAEAERRRSARHPSRVQTRAGHILKRPCIMPPTAILTAAAIICRARMASTWQMSAM
jgi:hypothetical protein